MKVGPRSTGVGTGAFSRAAGVGGCKISSYTGGQDCDQKLAQYLNSLIDNVRASNPRANIAHVWMPLSGYTVIAFPCF